VTDNDQLWVLLTRSRKVLAGAPSKPVRTRNRNIPVSNVGLKQIKALDCPFDFLWSLQSHLLEGTRTTSNTRSLKMLRPLVETPLHLCLQWRFISHQRPFKRHHHLKNSSKFMEILLAQHLVIAQKDSCWFAPCLRAALMVTKGGKQPN
jgi:hypothetical protein